jgi:hypothetical protein
MQRYLVSSFSSPSRRLGLPVYLLITLFIVSLPFDNHWNDLSMDRNKFSAHYLTRIFSSLMKRVC